MLFCDPILRGTSEEIFKTLDMYLNQKILTGKNASGFALIEPELCVIKEAVLLLGFKKSGRT